MFTSFKEFKNKISENNNPVLDDKNILTSLLNNTELNSLFKHDLLNSKEGEDYIFYQEEDVYTFAFTTTDIIYNEANANEEKFKTAITDILHNLNYELIDFSIFDTLEKEFKCYIEFKLKDETIQEIFGFSKKRKRFKTIKT